MVEMNKEDIGDLRDAGAVVGASSNGVRMMKALAAGAQAGEAFCVVARQRPALAMLAVMRLPSISPLPTGLTLRPATDADLPFLLALREQTMTERLRGAGYQPTAEDALARVLLYFEDIQLLLWHGEPAGMLKWRDEPEAWHIVQVQLLPAHQGRGLASALLGALCAQASAQGRPMLLSVLGNNPARRLYERLGFRVTGKEDDGRSLRMWREA